MTHSSAMIIQEINKNLTLCQRLDMQLVIIKNTKVICCSNLANQLNKTKLKNINRFFSQPYILQTIEKLDKKYPLLKNEEWDFTIQQKGNHTCYFEITNKEQFKQYNGYYMHENLYLLFINWLDKTKFIEYQELFNNYLDILTLQNIKTVEQALQNSQNQIQQLIEENNQKDIKIEKMTKKIPTEKDKIIMIKQKLRKYIQPQIDRFRKQNKYPECCKRCKRSFTFYVVDHVYPLHQIISDFLSYTEMSFDNLEINISDDIHKQWFDFHDQNKELQYLCYECNSKKGGLLDSEWEDYGQFNNFTMQQLFEYGQKNKIQISNELRTDVWALRKFLFEYKKPEIVYGNLNNMITQLIKKPTGPKKNPKRILEIKQENNEFSNMNYQELIQYAKDNNKKLPLHFSERDIEFIRQWFFQETESMFHVMQITQLTEYGQYYGIELSNSLRRDVKELINYLINYKGYGIFTNMSRNEVRKYTKENKIQMTTNPNRTLQMTKQFLFENAEKLIKEQNNYGKFSTMSCQKIIYYIDTNKIIVPKKESVNEIRQFLFENNY